MFPYDLMQNRYHVLYFGGKMDSIKWIIYFNDIIVKDSLSLIIILFPVKIG